MTGTQSNPTLDLNIEEISNAKIYQITINDKVTYRANFITISYLL